MYTSHKAHLDFLAATNQTIEETVDSRIRALQFVGLVVNESTDVEVYKKLAVYAHVVVDGQPSIHFISNANLVDGKAATYV